MVTIGAWRSAVSFVVHVQRYRPFSVRGEVVRQEQDAVQRDHRRMLRAALPLSQPAERHFQTRQDADRYAASLGPRELPVDDLTITITEEAPREPREKQPTLFEAADLSSQRPPPGPRNCKRER